MPLYKRKPFSLLEPQNDLDPHESVFQIRFTKEIFLDYEEYLKRLNFYRQRVWTCKVSGKSNLTYEEALVSEHHATEKVQQFPKDFIAPVLQMIQFSTANLADLVNEMYYKLEESIFEGLELQGKKDDGSVSSCKIINVLDDGHTLQYEVRWMDKDKKIIEFSILKVADLIHTKKPFSRRVLKEFIKESTYQNAPWVIHEKLAKKYGIPTEPPGELRDKLIQNGSMWSIKRRNNLHEMDISDLAEKKIKKGKSEGEPVRYPIDDLLVRPAPGDPNFIERPPLCLEFNVPSACVGDLIMVWDFCCTFGKLLHLWPFTLDDLENAVCHKDTNLILIVELHSSILHLLINDEGGYFSIVNDKKRKLKIRLINWAEYLCDFLEMKDREEFSSYIGTIKRGHYGLLEASSKLRILREVVAVALETRAIRDKLDERLEQQQALAALKRDEARRQKEESTKMENSEKETNELKIMENGTSIDGNSTLSETHADHVDDHQSDISNNAKNRGKKRCSPSLEEVIKKMRMENGSNTKSTRGQQRGKEKNKESQEMNPEATREHLEREIEKLSVRTNYLGKDRDYNRYWFFRREGRLFVENSDSTQWGYYTAKEELDSLLGSLNTKGERERGLKRQLEKYYNRISLALQKRSKGIAQKLQLEENILRRSIRVRAQPKDGSATAFLRYVNKWKETRSTKKF